MNPSQAIYLLEQVFLEHSCMLETDQKKDVWTVRQQISLPLERVASDLQLVAQEH